MTAAGIVPHRRVSLDVVFSRACLAVVTAYGFGAIPLSPRRYGAAVGVLGAAAVVVALRRHRQGVSLSVPLLLLLGWWALSLAWAETPWSWAIMTWQTIPPVLALAAVAAVVPAERAAPGLAFGCYVAMVLSALALVLDPLEATTNPDATIGWRGGFTHRNGMAMFLALALPTIALLERRRAWRIAGLAASLGLLIMSRSVTALVTTLAVSLAAVWLAAYRAREGRPSIAFAATTVVLGGAVLVGAVVLTPVIVPLLGKDLTLTGRTRIWEVVWRVAQMRPLTGHGVGVWLDAARPPITDIDRVLPFTMHHAHNGLLEILLELGAVGVVLYLAVVVETVVVAWRGLPAGAPVSRWAILVVVMMAVTSVAEPPVLGAWLAILAYAVTAARTTARRDRPEV